MTEDESIIHAHAIVRDAIGTPREALAKAYLEALVARVKREQSQAEQSGGAK